MTFEDFQNSTKWTKGADYKTNYGTSIGYYDSGEHRIKKMIDLENRTFIADYDAPIKIKRETDDESISTGAALIVDGGVATEKICLYNYSNSALKTYVFPIEDNGILLEDSGKKLILSPRSQEDFENLTTSQQDTQYVAATVGDIDKLKNTVALNKEQTILLLNLLKYVPELVDKRQEIENLIESLQQI